MMRLLLILVCIFTFAVSHCDEGTAKQILIVVTSADNPPYEFIQYGNIVGFDIDLVKIICKRLNKELKIKDISFSSIISTLRSKQGDMAIAGITPTEMRNLSLDFSIPYQTNTSAIVMINTGEFNNVKQGAYFPCELLKNKTIGVQFGTHHETDIRAADIENLTIRRYDSVNNLIAEMTKTSNKIGPLYGIILGISEARAIVQKNKNLIFYKLKFNDSFAIAFPRASPLRKEVNRIITDLINEGKIAELEAKWDIEK